MEIVGCDSELRSVGEFLERLRSGPGVLLLEGDPGVGKTTVWLAGREAARALGYRVLSCRPIPTETPQAFVALNDLLEPVLDGLLPELPPPQRHALEVALVRAKAEGERPDLHAISAAVRGMVRSLAVSGPVLLCVDDLQWLDRSSSRVLEFVIRRMEDEPVGLFVTSRTEAGAAEVARLVPEDRLQRRALGPLSIGAMQSILRERLGASFSRPLLLRIHAASMGNPFVALEMAREIVDLGVEPSATEPLPVPAALEDAARAWLGRLSAPVRRLLTLLAFLSQPTLEILDAASTNADTAQRDLDRAVRAGVVEVSGDRVRFTHPLLAEASAMEASPAQRRRLHQLLASVVPSPEERGRARHLALATGRPDAGVAAALEKAAHDVAMRGAADIAAELAEWSVRLTPVADRQALDARTVQSAEYHFAAFDLARARALLEDAMRSMPPGPRRAGVAVRLARVRQFADEGVPREVLVTALEEAGDDRRLLSTIHRELAWNIWLTGDIPRTIPHLEAALELAQQAGDTGLVGQMAPFLAGAEFIMGRGVRSDLLDLAASPDAWFPYLPMLNRPNLMVGKIMEWTDDLAAARARYRAEHDLAMARGAEADLPGLLTEMAALEIRAGDWATADELIERRSASVGMGGSPLLSLLFDYARGLLAVCRGAERDARAIAARMVETGQRSGNFLAMLYSLEILGVLELSLGDPAATLSHLQPLINVAVALGIEEPSQIRFMPEAIEANIALGNLDEAETLLEPFARNSMRLERIWGLATAGRCRGLLLAARGDVASGIGELEGALETHRRLPMPLELGRTLLAMGQVHRRAKHKREARANMQEAMVVFDQLGAARWSERAHAELMRVGVPGPAGTGLTPTEERVARLVGEGMTNREIAARLFLSTRTVEVNLSRVYGKLGVRSRVALTRQLAEQERTTAPKQ